MRADRDYVVAPQPSGCVAMLLRANILERAADWDSKWHKMGGAGRDGVAKWGITLMDMMKNDADHRRMKLVPKLLRDYQCLELLPKKICHCLNDYMFDSFDSLDLPPSNGNHSELKPAHLQNLLNCLRPLNTLVGSAEVAIFTSLSVGSQGRKGRQMIRCSPWAKFHCVHRQVATLEIALYIFV